MKIFFYLCTFVFGFMGVGIAAAAVEQAICGVETPIVNLVGGFILLLVAWASWHRARNDSEDEATEAEISSVQPANKRHFKNNQNNDDERQSFSVLLARAGMTAGLGAFMLVTLFNPNFGLILPLLPQARWPDVIRFAGYLLVLFLPTGFILSGLGLAGLASRRRKGILWPGLIGLVLSLVVGIPFCAGFLHVTLRARAAAEPPASGSVRAAAPIKAPDSARPAAPAPSRAVGIFIPAPERADMIHDPKRNLLYITAGDSVLRYQLASNTFLPPLVLGGNLRGIDLSPDNDCLAVADAEGQSGRIGIYLVDLKTGANSRATFPAEPQESGTYSVAFGADGAVWITSSLNGSGFVPLRKYNPVNHSRLVMQRVSEDTMLAASADRQIIGFAEGNISSGDYGRIRYRASQLPPTILRANAFLHEIGINRDGTQLAVPTGQNVLLSGTTVPLIDEPRVIGVAYHPQQDYVFLACGGSSVVAVYETKTGTRLKELDFGDKFNWANRAFESGRLRLSADGAWLFCTVNGGIRCAATGLASAGAVGRN
jgi:hypothetical protein